MCQLADLQTEEIWSSNERWLSNKIPRFLAVFVGCMDVCELIVRVGLSSLESCVELPKTRNSVLDGLSDRRLADIQDETWEIADCS